MSHGVEQDVSSCQNNKYVTVFLSPVEHQQTQ